MSIKGSIFVSIQGPLPGGPQVLKDPRHHFRKLPKANGSVTQSMQEGLEVIVRKRYINKYKSVYIYIYVYIYICIYTYTSLPPSIHPPAIPPSMHADVCISVVAVVRRCSKYGFDRRSLECCIVGLRNLSHYLEALLT